jgi:cytochrome c-type biogenesis protein
VGPILSAVLTLAASQESVLRGIALLAVYSAGLAVPFLLTAFGIDYFLEFYARFRRYLNVLEVSTGVLLIFFGVLIGLNKFTLINSWLSEIPLFKRVIEII